MTDDQLLMPRKLTAEMIAALRSGSLTGPASDSLEAIATWHRHLGWLMCAWGVLVEHADKQRAAQATGDGA